jgi:ribosomal protection tetracycline resistance protein
MQDELHAAGDFRQLTRVVLRLALDEAGTSVLEPISRFRLELPAETLCLILPALVRLGAAPHYTLGRITRRPN